MATTQKPCVLVSGKHKWVWQMDITHTAMGKLPGFLKLSRKGVYRCACGESKYGRAHSGL